MSLKAPFPYAGGKSRAAELVWSRFGDVPNYVEPFAGSIAVLLGRPKPGKVETVNDLDGFVTNAWRAIRDRPDDVARYANRPVVEADMHAVHLYLVAQRAQLTERLMADPDYCDPKLAGWWIWGMCTFIGGGWCSGEGPWHNVDGVMIRLSKEERAGQGITRQLPHLGNLGQGVNRSLPHLGDAGKGVNRGALDNPGLYAWMEELSQRLRRVRITNGAWDRILTPSVTTKHGITGVLLDPPYNDQNAENDMYATDYDPFLADKVWAWALEHGNDPKFRIAYCSYGDRELPPGWHEGVWKARKGYQKVQEDGTHNGHRERIYFSPHCLTPDASSGLF